MNSKLEQIKHLLQHNRLSEGIALAEELRADFDAPGSAAPNSERFELLHELGGLYFTGGKIMEAGETCEAALELYQKLPEAEQSGYEPDLAKINNHLAIIYTFTSRLTEAEERFAAAVAVQARLAEADPAQHEAYLLKILNNRASLYLQTDRLAEAEKSYQEQIAAIKRLMAEVSDTYEEELIAVYGNLAAIYELSEQMEKASQALDTAIAISLKMMERNPNMHGPLTADLYRTRGRLSITNEHWSEAEELLIMALKTWNSLAEISLDDFEPEMAKLNLCFAAVYEHTGRILQAAASYRLALRLSARYSSAYQHYAEIAADAREGLARVEQAGYA